MSDHLIKDAMAALGHWLRRDESLTRAVTGGVPDNTRQVGDSHQIERQ